MDWSKAIEELEGEADRLEVLASKAREAAASLKILRQEAQSDNSGRAKPAQKDRQSPSPSNPRGTQQPKLHPRREGRKFKGVREVPSRTGRPSRYHASHWDGTAKKVKHLGTFDDELEAAIAVAKALKDKPEIKRIQTLIDQRQRMAGDRQPRKNNPNRDGRSRQPKQPKAPKADPDGRPEDQGEVANVWECRQCFHQHLATTQPAKCEDCGSTNLRPLV